MQSFDYEEYRALRAEIDLRITLQNINLMLLAFAFAAACVAQVALPASRFHLAVGFGVTAGMLSLLWVHSGARTLQLKTYIAQRLEPQLRTSSGWEVWHARHRVAGILGSRWFISTKGLLIGSPLASVSFAALIGPPADHAERLSAMLVVAGAMLSAILLRKPRLSPEAYENS